MSDTLKRDQVAALAKHKPEQALEKARGIVDPWFRAQALALTARYSSGSVVKVAAEAARAASECDDAYKRVASRVWEIAALAETGHLSEASKALSSALRASADIVPLASMAEALILLLQAAVRIGPKERDLVYEALKNKCGSDAHWRCKRAVRDAAQICDGKLAPRPFFW